MTAPLALFLLLDFLAERTAVVLLHLKFVKLALIEQLLILLIKPLTETLRGKEHSKIQYLPGVLMLQAISPQRKPIFFLFFASKENHKLFKVWMYHATCPEQNFELVAAGFLCCLNFNFFFLLFWPFTCWIFHSK